MQAALIVGCVLGDVNHRTAIFPAKRKALQHAAGDQQHRGDHAKARPDMGFKPLVIGQQADRDGGHAHHRDGDQECALAAVFVAHLAKHQCAQRAHDEANREGEQCEHKCLRVGQASIEMFGDDRRQDRENEKVVPLKNGASRAGGDDLAAFGGVDG